MEKISVIIPVYKVEDYLHKCVDSVINQDYENLEIILVDDGSPDSCPAICDEYAKKDKRIKVIHKQNGGLSDARNAGIDAATGEYIIFLDSDDMLNDNSLGLIAEKAKHKPDIIIGNVMQYSEEGKALGLSQAVAEKDIKHFAVSDVLKYLGYKGIFWPAYRFIVRRELIIGGKLYFMKGILHEDLEWVPKAVSAASSFAVLDEPFYRYVSQRKGSITSKKIFFNYRDMLHVSRELFLKAQNLNDEARQYVLKGAKTSLLLAFENVYSMNKAEKNVFKKIINETKEIREITLQNTRMKKFTEIFGLWNGLVFYALIARIIGALNETIRGIK